MYCYINYIISIKNWRDQERSFSWNCFYFCCEVRITVDTSNSIVLLHYYRLRALALTILQIREHKLLHLVAADV